MLPSTTYEEMSTLRSRNCYHPTMVMSELTPGTTGTTPVTVVSGGIIGVRVRVRDRYRFWVRVGCNYITRGVHKVRSGLGLELEYVIHFSFLAVGRVVTGWKSRHVLTPSKYVKQDMNPQE